MKVTNLILPIIILLSTSCGKLLKESERATHDAENYGTHLSTSFMNTKDVSADDLYEPEESMVSEVGVYVGNRYYKMLEGDSKSFIETITKKEKPQEDERTYDNPGFISPFHTKALIEDFKSKYGKHSELIQYLFSKRSEDHTFTVLDDAVDISYSRREKVFYINSDLFLELNKEIELIYTRSGRYLGHIPYLAYYKKRAELDLRGYLHFQSMSYAKLGRLFYMATYYSQWIDENDYEQMIVAFQKMCINSNGLYSSECSKENIEGARNYYSLYYKWLEASREIEKEFLKIHHPLEGLQAEQFYDKEVITVLVKKPSDGKMARFLKESVEKAWNTDKYELKIEWSHSHDAKVSIEFVEEGPHHANFRTRVISMNRKTFQYDELTGVILAHEFGHVLGFKDCYHEFWDNDEDGYVFYKVDVTNVMCSNAGDVKDFHFEQLLKNM
ncbi:MAG: hypothetical protein HOE90_03555 [Bacteriovoracaceae bacterium]|jgi:hypothetical protein|nr:hypothetical protein [Bacteriovoracaceae bacterium]